MSYSKMNDKPNYERVLKQYLALEKVAKQGLVAEGSLNEFAPPSSNRGDGGGENERSRRLRKLLEIAIQVAKEKNVDELGMIHAMNMIAGDDFFSVAVEGILPDITDKEYMFVLQSAYKTVKKGVAEETMNEGVPSDNDMGIVPDVRSGTSTKMTLGQWKQMWLKKMPHADQGMFRYPPAMNGSFIAYFDGWENTPGARWDPMQSMEEEKQRLDPSCWKGYKKQGTKMKGGTRVNNCVPVKETNSSILEGIQQVDEINWKHAAAASAMALGALGSGGAHAGGRVFVLPRNE